MTKQDAAVFFVFSTLLMLTTIKAAFLALGGWQLCGLS